MKKVSRAISTALVVLISATALAGCGGNSGNSNDPQGGNSEGTGMTEDLIMQDTRESIQCVSLSEELGITYDVGKTPNTITNAYTWVVNELVLNSSNKYKKPLEDCELDLILKNGDTTLTVPGFWDGDEVWRVRFALPSAGEWTYETKCTNADDAGLNGKAGTITCTEYTGNLAIYKHGFIKTTPNVKYFTYADGTPFFYLGDTHWSLGSEPIKKVTELVKKRVEQGFTVIQSEPLGSTFDMTDGVSKGDISGFKSYDEKFREIADKGLVHANAALFFPSYMEMFIKGNGGYTKNKVGQAIHKTGTMGMFDVYDISDSAKAALKQISRYWVARYGAYPVMWTLGQEVDNDFYWNRDEYNSHEAWSYVNNPYIYMAQYFAEADAYKQPLSAHQEGVSNTNASESAFRDCAAHTWYASQWSQNYDKAIDVKAPKDYWENGQGKPVVLYEGKYCYLWTKNFGARVQGWMAFLSGMCGYGWGGQDTWCYGSSYDEDKDSNDGVDKITEDDKKNATYADSLEYPSTYQVGYMRNFLEKTVGDWYNFVPRFDDEAYFAPEDNSVFGICSSNEANTKIMLYFYNSSDAELAETPNASVLNAKKTGTVGSLTASAGYVYLWFNPVTGEKVSSGTFTAGKDGTWVIGEKATTDMVLYICKK